MICSLCKHTEFERVSERDAKSGDALEVGMCSNCGLVQQLRPPSDIDLSFYYTHTYREEYKGTIVPKPKHILRSAIAAADRLRFLGSCGVTSGKLLDVGSGSGEFVYLARKSGFDAYGLEPNRGYSEYAQGEYGPHYDTGFLDSARGGFDAVTLFHVLEHLPDPVEAFSKLYSLLKKSGLLFVEVPWIEACDASPRNIYFRAHVHYFSVDTLGSCANAFFEVDRIDTKGNLRALLRPRPKPLETSLPDTDSVTRLRLRLNEKGWSEYLFQGGGLAKPARKIANAIRESRVRSLKGRQIADLVHEERLRIPGTD